MKTSKNYEYQLLQFALALLAGIALWIALPACGEMTADLLHSIDKHIHELDREATQFLMAQS